MATSEKIHPDIYNVGDGMSPKMEMFEWYRSNLRMVGNMGFKKVALKVKYLCCNDRSNMSVVLIATEFSSRSWKQKTVAEVSVETELSKQS